MQPDGFLAQQNRSPAGLGIVVALHAAAISALILFPPKFVIEEIPSFIVDSIPMDEPPPPEPEMPPPPPQPKAEQAVTRPEVIVPTGPTKPAIDLTTIIHDIVPTVPKVDPVTPATPEPVLTEAAIDPRASFQPDYPPRLARQDVEGSTVVRVLIGADGRVKAIEMVSATDPEFFEATKKQALRHWRFKPATRDGVPVESWRTLTVRFELKA